MKMERLNKRQKEILTYLNKFPYFSLKRENLLNALNEPKDKLEIILYDIKLLKEKGLVKQGQVNGDMLLTITPKGKEQLQLRENIITRIQEYDTLIKLIAVLLALISVILGLIKLWK